SGDQDDAGRYGQAAAVGENGHVGQLRCSERESGQYGMSFRTAPYDPAARRMVVPHHRLPSSVSPS
ncbi:hypothetical protein, partial [Streptomyces sp. Wh19]|uniref:hypothetical protein n=1 Tax=Streptomyces sp. Wh19 TaxID=3076629 RepID=UPI0029585EC8